MSAHPLREEEAQGKTEDDELCWEEELTDMDLEYERLRRPRACLGSISTSFEPPLVWDRRASTTGS